MAKDDVIEIEVTECADDCCGIVFDGEEEVDLLVGDRILLHMFPVKLECTIFVSCLEIK